MIFRLNSISRTRARFAKREGYLLVCVCACVFVRASVRRSVCAPATCLCHRLIVAERRRAATAAAAAAGGAAALRSVVVGASLVPQLINRAEYLMQATCWYESATTQDAGLPRRRRVRIATRRSVGERWPSPRNG